MEFKVKNVFTASGKTYPIELESISNPISENYFKMESTGFHPGRMKSATTQGCKRCLTKQAMPLIATYQALGIFPVNYSCRNCKLSHYWISIPSLINMSFLVGDILASVFVFQSVIRLFERFRGTDMYTGILVAIAQFVSTLLTYAAGNFGADSFCKG